MFGIEEVPFRQFACPDTSVEQVLGQMLFDQSFHLGIIDVDGRPFKRHFLLFQDKVQPFSVSFALGQAGGQIPEMDPGTGPQGSRVPSQPDQDFSTFQPGMTVDMQADTQRPRHDDFIEGQDGVRRELAWTNQAEFQLFARLRLLKPLLDRHQFGREDFGFTGEGNI